KRIDMEPEDNTKTKSKKIATDVCKALGIWDTIGKKWSLLILRYLSANDNTHFNELKRLLGISSNVLAKKLKQLEQEGLVTRRAVYENSPLRVEYKITPLAKELDAIFIGLEKWVAKWETRDELRY
ncbi:MAG TPA: helix-turn-helix domain-containing protein, partial [Nitrososphaeraceae archaeon]|nr:helix-turn-helix domain-containing protein [Nitrososphaeraceae archaeon]